MQWQLFQGINLRADRVARKKRLAVTNPYEAAPRRCRLKSKRRLILHCLHSRTLLREPSSAPESMNRFLLAVYVFAQLTLAAVATGTLRDYRTNTHAK